MCGRRRVSGGACHSRRRAVRCDVQPERQRGAVATARVIEAHRPVGNREPPPCPCAEIGFKRAAAEIGIEISVTLPSAPRRSASTSMRAVGAKGRQRWRLSGVRATSTSVTATGVSVTRPRTGVTRGRAPHLVDVDDQFSARPAHLAWPDRQAVRITAQRGAAPVGHGEASAGAIGGDVQADVVLGVAPPRPAIPGRKDRPMKAMIEMACGPSSETPSTYHQA